MSTRSDVVEQLRSRDVRITAQRLVVAEVLLGSKRHASAQQIYESVKEQFPYISRGTVYNTLSMLEKCGFVQALPFPGGVRYDVNLTSHVNVVCTKCGAILDAEDYGDSIQRLKAEVSSNTRYQITAQRLDFYGLCPLCHDDSGSPKADTIVG